MSTTFILPSDQIDRFISMYLSSNNTVAKKFKKGLILTH